MRHPLLISPLVNFQVPGILLKGLSDPQHVPMTKNGEDPLEQLLFLAVHLDILAI